MQPLELHTLNVVGTGHATNTNDEQEKEGRTAAAEKRRRDEQLRLGCEEEGLTLNHGIAVRYRRWRASAALAAVLPAHPCPAHAMSQHTNATNTQWILSGGDDLTVRLWDTEAFMRKLADPNEDKAAKAVERAGAVAADVALGWECIRELAGHTAAIRDVAFNPLFQGVPAPVSRAMDDVDGRISRVETQGAADLRPKRRAGEGGEAIGDDGCDRSGGSKPAVVVREDGDGTPAKTGNHDTLARPEYMLASASADLTVRVWDLTFNPRIARFVQLRDFVFRLSLL